MEAPRRPRNAFVGGMANLAIIAGYARQISLDSGKVVSLAVQQTNNINTSLPVFYESERRRPAGALRDTSSIKLTGHVFGRRLPNGRRVAEFSVLTRERPTLVDLPGIGCWAKRIPEGGVPPDLPSPPQDVAAETIDPDTGEEVAQLQQAAQELAANFRPYDGYTYNDRPPLNMVRVAGIVYASMMAKERDGKTSSDCLEVLVCQHADPDKAIPVRIYGKYARQYAQTTVPGLPIYIEGQFRVRVDVVEKGVDGAPDTVERYPYIHAAHVRLAQEDDIEKMPEWAEKQIEEIAQARRQVLDERKGRVAKPLPKPRLVPTRDAAAAAGVATAPAKNGAARGNGAVGGLSGL